MRLAHPLRRLGAPAALLAVRRAGAGTGPWLPARLPGREVLHDGRDARVAELAVEPCRILQRGDLDRHGAVLVPGHGVGVLRAAREERDAGRRGDSRHGDGAGEEREPGARQAPGPGLTRPVFLPWALGNVGAELVELRFEPVAS